MTESPRVAPLEFADIDGVAAAIRAAGGRLTAARRLVLEALFDADGPASAELIAARIAGRGPAFNLTSVYRSLERLEALGVVRHVHLGHGPGLYALVGGGDREYLACERCNRVTSVEPAELDAIRRQIGERFGYEARFTHFPITGLCPDCAGAATTTTDRRSGGDRPMTDQHSHDEPHAHEHSHDGETHSHPHDGHDHEHTEHEHEHGHGDQVHSHPHIHQKGLEDEHEHEHPDDRAG
jgi:Fur family transcriptional regulator, ferric uptake regulator